MKESHARHLLSCPPDGDFTVAVREVIRGTRQTGWLSIDRVAALAGMSVRTLQRRLAKEDTVFSELVDEMRVELAVEMLKNTEGSVAAIASATGYLAVENFIRAFKRWTGKTPAEFRQR
jgi:AraC-like DNA-binding protein